MAVTKERAQIQKMASSIPMWSSGQYGEAAFNGTTTKMLDQSASKRGGKQELCRRKGHLEGIKFSSGGPDWYRSSYKSTYKGASRSPCKQELNTRFGKSGHIF